MIDVAYAQCAANQGQSQGGGWMGILPFIFIFVILYFLMIRPQQKKQQEHRAMLEGLKKGDKIISSGGIIGVISGISDDAITMEIAPKVRIKITRGSVAGKVS